MYPYKLRPTLNGEYAMIEFPDGPSKDSFIDDFTAAIALLNPELLDKGAGISTNDFMVYHYNSILGEFFLTIDIWQIAFVNADKEELLLMIDSRLLQHPLFEKIN